MSKEEEFGEEGARPSSLIPVHRPAVRDPLHDLQLLRDVAIINEQVRRELGPPVAKQRQAPAEREQQEGDTVKLKHLAAVAAASIGTTSSWGAPQSPTSRAEAIPEAVAKYVDDDKALLAYKSIPDGNDGRTTAIILRHPKAPAPNHASSYSDREGYSCELVLLSEKDGSVTLTGRNRKVVDCEFNQINLMVSYLDLNDQLELSTAKVTFRNDITPLGSYTTSFEQSGGLWHLSSATYVYTDRREGEDEILVVKESVSYPKQIDLIPMDQFDPEKIETILSKNKTLVP